MSLTPRQQRALQALLRGPVMRETLDAVAGASNGPMLVAQLRRKGIAVDCERLTRIDRDGRVCRPGRYYLHPAAKRQAKRLLGQ